MCEKTDRKSWLRVFLKEKKKLKENVVWKYKDLLYRKITLLGGLFEVGYL